MFCFKMRMFRFILLATCITAVFAQHYQETEYYRAEQMFIHARYSEALQIIDSISVENPYYQNALILKGHIYLSVDSLKKAESAFKDVLSVNPNSELAYNGLGLVHYNRITERKTVTKFIRRLFVTPEAEKSEAMFKRALELNETYTDARYNLSRLYIRTGDETDKITAENLLSRLVSNHPSNTTYAYALGEIKLQLGRYDEARRIYSDLLLKDPDDGNVLVQIAFIYWNEERYDLFSDYYLDGLSSHPGPVISSKLTRDCWDILTVAEQKVAEKGTLPLEWLLKMWKRRDPNPISSINERLVVHYKRLETARGLYTADTYTGYDDRGSIYVRYGEPDIRYTDQMPGFDVKANESWSYKMGNTTVSFDFVQEGSYYTLVDDLTEAMNLTSLGKTALNVLVEMYQNRSHLDGYYQRITNDLLAVDPSSVKNVSSLSSLVPAVTRHNINRTKKREHLPVSTYDFKLEGSDLPFHFDYAWFYNEKEQIRLEFYFALNQAGLRKEPQEKEELPVIDQSVLIQTRDYETIVRGSNKIPLNTLNKTNGDFIFQTNVLLTDFSPICTIQLENKSQNQKRLIQFPVSIPPFEEKAFSVSDVQLSADIHAKTELEGRLFTKKGLYILPYPYTTVRKSQPIYFYFEIYNLNKFDSGMAEYEVELKLFQKQNPRNLVNVLKKINPFQPDERTSVTTSMLRKSNEEVIADYFALDMSALNRGDYELIIQVTALKSGDMVNRKIEFELVD